ncbi:MAG: FGGY-family carbohydrate kinase, partial [Cyanobacteria bacterium P01_H01_bin.130]
MVYLLGVDFGTSGGRAIVLSLPPQGSGASAIAGQSRTEAPQGLTGAALAQAWWDQLETLLEQLPIALRRRLGAIAINGTSSTVLLATSTGEVVAGPLMYNDDRGRAALKTFATLLPGTSGARSATSTLAKVWWWRGDRFGNRWPVSPHAPLIFHQADWLSFQLHGRLHCPSPSAHPRAISDYHNALKLGYDPIALAYPHPLQTSDFGHSLPHVVAPGSIIGPILPAIAQRFGINPQCQIVAGTTDSIAAFLASGADQPGEAVTSLGSTLVLKQLSTVPVNAPEFGIYSHRLGDRWLVGGASNTGGAVLKQFFSSAELTNLSQGINPAISSPYDYYPLIQPGERFPINDPDLQPRLTPRPADDSEYLQGLLEAIARIEAQGYQRLAELGADPLTQIQTAGGGAQNPTWMAIRQRYFSVPVTVATQTEAAYGSAK